MSGVLLVQGDARQIPLRDGSVHVCVCSPPYYGLRDYGTGRWVGGEAGCTHKKGIAQVSTMGKHRGGGGVYANTNHAEEPYRDHCGRCGAVRVDQQIGLEDRADCNGAFTGHACGSCWICAMRAVFAEVSRVMRPEATLWLNCGDAYNAHPGQRSSTDKAGPKQQTNGGSVAIGSRHIQTLPAKSLLGLPWRLALALQSDGWILRSAITWCKAAPMPESVTDRPTRATEMLFLFAKQPHYFYDATAVRVTTGNGWHGSSFTSAHDVATKAGLGQQARHEAPGRNLWDYWVLGPEPTSFQHYASFPTELVRKCLLAGAPTQTCRACGKPWVRQVEREAVPKDRLSGQPWLAQTEGIVLGRTTAPNNGLARPYTLGGHTTGFSPTCACGAPGDGKAVVLDPFCGSGTTLLVARELGYHGIGLDLSYPYLHDIARERLGLAALHRWSHGATTRAECYGDLPLFGG